MEKIQQKQNDQILFNDVEKIILNNNFYGLTAKRNSNKSRVLYTYHSVKWPNILIRVLTTKLNPKQIPSTKIVLGIKFNECEINTWNEFIQFIKHQNLREFNKKQNLTNEKISQLAKQI